MNTVQIDRPPIEPATEPPRRPVLPSGRLGRFGVLVAERPKTTLVLVVLALAVFGTLGAGLFPNLRTQGFDVPGSESDRAATVLSDEFDVRDPVLVVALELPAGVDDPASAAAATALAGDLATVDGVDSVVSYWTSGRPDALRGSDGLTGSVLVGASSTDAAERADVGTAAQDVVDRAVADDPGLVAYVSGEAAVGNALNETITDDLARAEAIAVPVTFVLLLIVFGSLISAGLPFLVAAGSVLGSFFLVWMVSLTTDVSVFALNLITGLGLGLGIDYALLVVNRFREELRDSGPAPGRDVVRAAVARTVATAGRTVLFSAATVFVVLGAMTFFQQYFLRSFGYAGMAATGMAALAAVTGLPATLALLGTRVDRLRVLRRDLTPRDEGAWAVVARFVMRRPVPVLVVVVALLGVLASPALGVSFSQVDSRVLPQDHPTAVAAQVLSDRFDGNEGSPVQVVVPAGVDDGAMTTYAEDLARLDDVTSVSSTQGVFVDGARVGADPRAAGFRSESGAQRLSVVTDVPSVGAEAADVVTAVRDAAAPTSGVLVGGASAAFLDSQDAIASRGVWALAWVALATLVLLFLFTGSVVIAAKAVVVNLVSLSAMLGAVVWVFQEGHLQWLVGDFTVTGSVDTAMAVLVAITAFALSMDYEVFLLSRIVEEHRRGASTSEAVALGLQRSGRIITAAAVLLAVVFAAFLTSGVTNIKQLGFGVAFAILLDATVVRGLLVPALMRLLGHANWWTPRPLARLHRRFALREA
jgi:putative drug exporter of the RND superfamily